MSEEFSELGSPFVKLISIFFLGLLGTLIAGLFMFLVIYLQVGDYQSAMELLSSSSFTDDASMTRFLLLLQHLGSFIIPAILFGLIFYRKYFFPRFDLQALPTWKIGLAAVVFIFVSLPLVNLSFMLNEMIPLPSWALGMEDQAAATLESILEMDHLGMLALNFLLIAVMPGIGEELIFRGIVQKYFGKWISSPIAGIWISAFLFSLMHMQFEGFLPRMALGAVLGYLYYWTGNLWVPILAHIFNNGIQVIVYYFSNVDMSSTENIEDGVTWYLVLGSIATMWVVYTIIKNERSRDVGLA